ncbi:hypothetical protein FRC15_010253 [Serendipita sp. 397]|nr:hypothetical protein FRC15_010253 [Serendipita sp. 397]
MQRNRNKSVRQKHVSRQVAYGPAPSASYAISHGLISSDTCSGGSTSPDILPEHSLSTNEPTTPVRSRIAPVLHEQQDLGLLANTEDQSCSDGGSLDEFLALILFSLDPTSPGVSPPFLSDDDELLENMTNSFGSARTTPKDEMSAESIIGEPQYAALIDLPTLFPYPPPTLAPADNAAKENLEVFVPILGESGDQDANTGAQTLERVGVDISCLSTALLVAVPSTSNSLAHVHSKRRGERTAVDISLLSRAFTEESPHPDAQKRALLVEFLRSGFYLNQEHEPRLGTLEAEFVFSMAGVPSSLAYNAPRNGSVFSPFVDMDTMTCLFCAKTHKSVKRVIGCVRSHIGHRPFVCGGDKDGCNSCTESRWVFLVPPGSYDLLGSLLAVIFGTTLSGKTIQTDAHFLIANFLSVSEVSAVITDQCTPPNPCRI